MYYTFWQPVAYISGGVFIYSRQKENMRKITPLLFFIFALAACNLNYDPYAALMQSPPSLTPSPITDKPNATAPAATAGAMSCTVTAPLHLRTGAGVSYAVIGYLQAGDIVTIQTQRGAWYEVTTASGAGFIHSQYCEKVKP